VPSTLGYRLYGFTLSSTLALPFPLVLERRAPSVVMRASAEARFASARREFATTTPASDNWFCYKRLSNGSTYLHWDGLFEFLISADGRRILYRRLKHGTSESLTVYLLGPVLSFSLLARRIEPLHGTATVIDGSAVVFVGGCGQGKSTLAAALLATGFPVLTDDLVALAPRGSQWMVYRGLPRLKIFPSIARRVLNVEARKPQLNDRTSKLVLPLNGGYSRRAMVPVKCIYVLDQPSGQTTQPGVRIEPLAPREAFLEIVGAAFNLAVVDRERLANQFVFARRLAADVPLRRLIYPRRLSALSAVCEAVLEDVKRDRLPRGAHVAGIATT
jgi:hypothetical protein